MIRDEADVIEAWTFHQLELFDYVLVADHGSVDGTLEFLREVSRAIPRLRLVEYKQPTYDQHVVLNVLRRMAVNDLADLEWVFVLDADEFLTFADKQSFVETLSSVESYDVLTFHWRNSYPRHPGPIGQSIDGYRDRSPSPFGKVAIRRNIAADADYAITQGAHNVAHRLMGQIEGFAFGELIHLPIRSQEQARSKILQGCDSYLSAPDYDPRQGHHWFDILNRMMVDGQSGWSFAPALVHQYGIANNARDIDVAMQNFDRFHHHLPMISVPATLAKAVGLLDGHRPIEIPHQNRILERIARRGFLKHENFDVIEDEIRELTDFGNRTFPALADATPAPVTSDALVDALQSAFWPIEHRPGSAWGEHIPFLFSVLTLLKPRRLVELGVHNGASFLAACQAVRHLQTESECVAVDNWIGDAHAGTHSSSVFSDFRNNLAQYKEFAGYLRMNFSEALPQFAEGSIDLLHIDGFHTAEAVRRDFDQWIGKMSDQGVILFHDTNEFRSDFGVWRFWRKIREQYPHVEFGHSHGLGVLVVGKNSPLTKSMTDTVFGLLSVRANEFLQVIFGNVGRLSWAPKPVASPPPTAPAVAPVDVTGLNSRIAELEHQLHKYNKSIYGRARRSIRRIRMRAKGSKST